MNDKRLRTIKRAAQEIGASRSFLQKLVAGGELQKYKIPGHSAVYISLTEFESIASPIQHVKSLT